MGFHDSALNLGGNAGFEAVLVEEVYEGERGEVTGPVRALMSALLFDAIATCLNYAGSVTISGQHKFQEALTWLGTAGDEYVFSFENICSCLGIDPDALRVGLINACNSRQPGSKKTRRSRYH